ncbi:hypothetical protein XENTR_v10011235 [Xenopus tropicalis]|nr:hypothetical protein XENTR_v10011235 [Xenopus tropicalis]
MRKETLQFFTCAVLLFLVSESWCAPKNKLMARNWGPQSMMYLKGRHGRRVASEYEEGFEHQNLDFMTTFLKRYETSLPVKILNFRRRQLSQIMDYQYLD